MSKYEIGPDIDLDTEVVLDRDGTRITEARAREIADEVDTAIRGRGRPSLSGDTGESPVLRFRVPEQLRRRLDERAAAEGRDASEVARDALARYLDG